MSLLRVKRQCGRNKFVVEAPAATTATAAMARTITPTTDLYRRVRSVSKPVIENAHLSVAITLINEISLQNSGIIRTRHVSAMTLY